MMISWLSCMSFSRWEEEQKTITLRAEAVLKRHSTFAALKQRGSVEMRQDYIFININSMNFAIIASHLSSLLVRCVFCRKTAKKMNIQRG